MCNLFNNRIRIVCLLMLVISVLTLIAALTGVFYTEIYKDLVSTGLISNFEVAGSVNQDLLSIPCGLALFIISLLLYIRKSYKLLIVALGLVGYIFYGYAVYTFGGLYTPIYFVYIVIFVLSVYCLIMGILSFNSNEIVDKLKLGKNIRISIGVFLILMTSVMSIKWISEILIDSFNQTRSELYIISAMDLGFVLPACGVFAVMILRNKAYGVLLTGIVLVKIFTLCLSVAIGTFIAPYFELPADYGVLVFFGTLTILSLILMVLYLKGVSLDDGKMSQ